MKLNEIKPNKANPRVIKDDKFKKLVRSLQSFPEMMQKRPIVVDSDMTILGGNMRYKALVEIYGKSGEIPDEWVTTADGWTDEQKREFIIKDNASFGEWDVEMLQEAWNVDEVNEWGVDVPEWDDPSEGVSPDDFGDNFELPKGDKAPFQQMAFTLADGQAELIKQAIEEVKGLEEFKFIETMGNTNTNGNALYLIVSQWESARK